MVRLSGYGVELAIKSTEYTAVDDSVVSEGMIYNNLTSIIMVVYPKLLPGNPP